jgi:hypothetical protein
MLLRECFEGKEPALGYTWFVEGKEGLFDALDTVNADQASLRPGSKSTTIAAHAFHVLYALEGSNALHGAPEPEGNWEDSWRQESVTGEEWSELKAAIHVEYASFMKWFRNHAEWDDEAVRAGAIATLPHMAFHLGAIRQLIRLCC